MSKMLTTQLVLTYILLIDDLKNIYIVGVVIYFVPCSSNAYRITCVNFIPKIKPFS